MALGMVHQGWLGTGVLLSATLNPQAPALLRRDRARLVLYKLDRLVFRELRVSLLEERDGVRGGGKRVHEAHPGQLQFTMCRQNMCHYSLF